MPRLPARYCSKPGCGIKIRGGGSYCGRHIKKVRAAQDSSRPNSAGRGYGSQWQRIRKRILKITPLCYDPWGVHAAGGGGVVLATEVHHKIPIRLGGNNHSDNLVPLCRYCHNRYTNRDRNTQPGVGGDQSLGAGNDQTGRGASHTPPRK